MTGTAAKVGAASVAVLAPSILRCEPHCAKVLLCFCSDGVVLCFVVQLGQKDRYFDQNVRFEVHQCSVPPNVVVVVFPDMDRQTGIYEGKDVDQDKVFKGWRQLFISGEGVVLPANFVSSFLEVGNNKIAILIVEAHDTGSRFVVQVQQVEEMDSFLLYVVVFSKFVVDPLEAGRVAGDDIVVVDVAGFGDDTQEGAKLRSSGGQCR